MNTLNTTTIIIIAAVLVVIIALIVVLLIRNSHKKNLKKKMDELYVRFNDIKTVPLAFKLNKAQTMAKRNEDMAKEVETYLKRYNEVDMHINDLQQMLNDADDSQSEKSYMENLETLDMIDLAMKECEAEVKEIDDFLEEFSKKENQQRDYSTKLKEKYRIVKTTINKNSQILSISYDGFVKKLEECESLFSSSEEFMYASDYVSAQNDLEKIDEILESIKTNANKVPKLLKDLKGVVPLMMDETKREIALTKQRGVYIDHLEIDEKMAKIEESIDECTKKIMDAETNGIKADLSNDKDILNSMNEALEDENRSFKQAKETNEKAYEHIRDMEKVEEYVRIAYHKESARFGLEDLSKVLSDIRNNISKYKAKYEQINVDLISCVRPSSDILSDADELFNAAETDLKTLYSYKSRIDKSTDGESRAASQLTKLQLVVSEVETKLLEYSLPTIDESYKNDLHRAREYIEQIREMIAEVPINIEELNALLDEAIDFTYKFYNNINNVVGMSIMVENAVVFGNKYRSTYPEIDRELSKAEFQYLNGEYTKALKTAISCIETLFPDDADEKIMRNA
ncbi:MAG: hypothetical protein IKF80_11365 [Erysipelotrichaceae bacterium]|nr:hypothetical protein [Erysipelotrichaceae bacterium]